MRRTVRALAIVSCIAMTAGCDVESVTFGVADGARRPLDRWIETDSLIYTLRHTAATVEVDIGFTFRNRSRATLAVPRCAQPHRPVLEKLVAGWWQEVFTPVEECWGEPLLIPPGAVRQFTFRVRAARPHTGLLPRFETPHLPGTYRLRWEVFEYDPHTPYQFGPPLPLEYRVSNRFELVD